MVTVMLGVSEAGSDSADNQGKIKPIYVFSKKFNQTTMMNVTTNFSFCVWMSTEVKEVEAASFSLPMGVMQMLYIEKKKPSKWFLGEDKASE